MSAPEPPPLRHAAPGASLAMLSTDIVEIAALKGRAPDLERIATGQGSPLPALGHILCAGGRVAISVRPERWLLLTRPLAAGTRALAWRDACTGVAAAIDLSCAFAALYMSGPALREVLARGCRLDLHPAVFPAGRAAATVMAQVAVVLAAMPAGMLLLTPATTARYFTEWIVHSAAPFGLERQALCSLSLVSGDPCP